MENSHDPFYGYQPHQQHPRSHHPDPANPQVYQTGSRSVEYVFLTIALLTAAASLIVGLIVWVNGSLLKGGISFDALAFPAAALVIALPVLMVLFMDLKKAELKDPSLAADPYKKRSEQFTKIIAFTTCFFTLIGFVYGIFTNSSYGSSSSLGRLFADVLIILVVAGGILVYYIVNERQKP